MDVHGMYTNEEGYELLRDILKDNIGQILY